MARPSFRLLSGLCLLLALSACADESGDWRAHQRLVVERRPVSLLLPMQDDSVIRPEDFSRLQSFVDVFINRGEAPFSVSVSADESEDAQAAAKRHAERINELLTAMGVDAGALKLRTVPASPSAIAGTARLGYDIYAVRVPQCGDWSDNTSFSPLRNDPSPSFGCAVTHNIGLMVENPRDLVRPHAMDGRDAARGATIIGKYRAGEETVSKGVVTTTISSVGASQ